MKKLILGIRKEKKELQHLLLLFVGLLLCNSVLSKDKYNSISVYYTICSKEIIVKNKIKSYTVHQNEPNTNNIWKKYYFNKSGDLIKKEYSVYKYNNIENIVVKNYYYIDNINQIPSNKSKYDYYYLKADSNFVKSFWRNDPLIKTYKKKGIYAIYSDENDGKYIFFIEVKALDFTCNCKSESEIIKRSSKGDFEYIIYKKKYR